MENTDRICGNCGYWCFDESSPDRFYGICYHFSWTDGQSLALHARTETCSGFSSRFVRPPSPGIYQDPHLRIRDLENEIDRLATRRAQLEHVHREDTDTIERLHEGCSFYSKRIAEQETTIARLTIERDQARDVAERHVVQCSKLAADRDTARAALAACESNFDAWRKEMDTTIKFLKLDLENVRVIRENELLHHAKAIEAQDMKLLTLVREKDACEQENRKLQSQLDAYR